MVSLPQYLKERGLTQAAFAQLGPWPEATVSRWCNREAIPRPANMRRIAELTGGAVPPAAWFMGEAAE